MIDEPLALLAEAFGRDPNAALPPLAYGETGAGRASSDELPLATVIAAASVLQAEGGAFAARAGQAGWA